MIAPARPVKAIANPSRIALVVLLLLIALSAAVLSGAGVAPAFDQIAVQYRFSFHDYPTFEQGVSSWLIIGIYNLFDSWEPVSSNAHIRILSMIIFLTSAFLLVTAFRDNDSNVPVLCLLLLFTARYPFQWHSGELLAASFLMLTLASEARQLPFAVTAAFLAAFCLAKPDLLFSGLIVGCYLAWNRGYQRSERIRRLALIPLFLACFLLPGLIFRGGGYLKTEGRAVSSFEQHYAALIKKHQITPWRPDPWLDTSNYIQPTWGDIGSVPGAVAADPSRYLDFLFLSMSYTTKSSLVSGLLLVLIPACFCLAKTKWTRLKIAALLFFTGLVPITLLSFMHVRYTARFYPLALFLICGSFASLDPRQRRLVTLYLVALLIFQAFLLVPVLRSGYWFVD